jgi:hypothetical protein
MSLDNKKKEMKSITQLFSVLALLAFFVASCQPEENKIPPCYNGVQDGDETSVDCGGSDCPPCQATCDDGIQNQGEQGIDCGGPCPLCATCFDGVQNGQETGIDCGGPECPPCPPSCNDLILNGTEDGVDCGGNCLVCDPQMIGFEATVDGTALPDPNSNATITVGVMNVTGSASGYQISLNFPADITVGTYDIVGGSVVATLNNASVSPPLFSATAGTLIIDEHNVSTKAISGTFSFSGVNDAASTVEVTDGYFSLTY